MRRFRDVCLLGLVLGLSGCAGMQQRLASHPGDPEKAARSTLASRGGRLRHQAAESHAHTPPREPSATKTAAKSARPLTNRPPEAVSRYFPGMSRRDAGAAGAPEAESARPDPLGIRTSAKQESRDRPVPEEGRTRAGGETPSSLPAALNVSVHPDDPSSLYPDALNAVKPGAERADGRPEAVRRPRDEPAPEPRAVTLPEPVEALKTRSDAVPNPEGSAAVDPAPAGGRNPHESAVVATSASAAPELPGLTLDQEPAVPTSMGADEAVPIPNPDLPPVRGELPQARAIDKDIDNDPILAGRPRLRLASPGVAMRQDDRSERLPDAAFPASYYAFDPQARPAVATATVASPAQARPRRTLFARLFRRTGESRPGTPAGPSARPKARDLAQRGDVIDRVAAGRLDEPSKR